MNTLQTELAQHILDMLNDGVVHDDNIEEMHFHCFNEDYYIIGHYQAEKWIKKHYESVFSAIDKVKEYEQDNFGEVATDLSSSERVANMLAYIEGEELIHELSLMEGDAEYVKNELMEYLEQ